MKYQKSEQRWLGDRYLTQVQEQGRSSWSLTIIKHLSSFFLMFPWLCNIFDILNVLHPYGLIQAARTRQRQFNKRHRINTVQEGFVNRETVDREGSHSGAILFWLKWEESSQIVRKWRRSIPIYNNKSAAGTVFGKRCLLSTVFSTWDA